MYRVIVVVIGALTLAACSSTPSWMSLDSLKPEPLTDSITFESSPPGAQARTSSGQTCTTPCSLALPVNAPLSVTFSLNGYTPETEQIELVAMGDGTSRLQPNPISVELTAAAPAPAKKPVAKKKPAAKKPSASAKPAAQAAVAAPATTTAAAPDSPWTAPQPAR